MLIKINQIVIDTTRPAFSIELFSFEYCNPLQCWSLCANIVVGVLCVYQIISIEYCNPLQCWPLCANIVVGVLCAIISH